MPNAFGALLSDLRAPDFVGTVVKGMSIVASFGLPTEGFEFGSCWKPSRENRCLVDILTADVGILMTASQLIRFNYSYPNLGRGLLKELACYSIIATGAEMVRECAQMM